MRDLIIEALEKALQEKRSGFQLRDAAVGSVEDSGPDPSAVNAAIDQLREPTFRL